MEPSREIIEDLMQRYGYEEKEAEAAYYLREAWSRFTNMYKDEAEEGVAEESGGLSLLFTHVFLTSYVHPHFRALNSLLARRVLARQYPEGWGSRRSSEREG